MQSPSFNLGSMKLSMGSSTPRLMRTTSSTKAVKDLGRRKWWIVDPRTSKLASTWDGFMTVALLYVAFVTPLEVGFLLEPTKSGWEPIFVANRVGDLVFVMDGCLNFCMMYHSETGWVSNPRKIALNYMRGWYAYACARARRQRAIDDNVARVAHACCA
jgi:hypothetical protein